MPARSTTRSCGRPRTWRSTAKKLGDAIPVSGRRPGARIPVRATQLSGAVHEEHQGLRVPPGPGQGPACARPGTRTAVTVQICTFSSDTTEAATIEKDQMAPAGIKPADLAGAGELVPVREASRTGGVPMVQIGWFFPGQPVPGLPGRCSAPRAPAPRYAGVDDLLGTESPRPYTEQDQKPLYDQMNELLYGTAPSVPTLLARQPRGVHEAPWAGQVIDSQRRRPAQRGVVSRKARRLAGRALADGGGPPGRRHPAGPSAHSGARGTGIGMARLRASRG